MGIGQLCLCPYNAYIFLQFKEILGFIRADDGNDEDDGLSSININMSIPLISCGVILIDSFTAYFWMGMN